MKDYFLNVTISTVLCGVGLMFFTISNAQTGPGGVGDNTTNALWLDAHTMGGADGASISTLIDYSGNGAAAVQSNSSRRPTYALGSINGRNAVNFDGSNDILVTPAIPALTDPDFVNTYLVTELNSFSGLRIPFNIAYANTVARDFAFLGTLVQGSGLKAYGRSSSSLKTALYNSPSGPNIFESIYNNSLNRIQSIQNFIVNNTNNTASYHTGFDHDFCSIGGLQNNYFSDGDIAEIIVFTTELNSAQKKIVENYLGAKFGRIPTTDLYSHEINYGLGLIGIGRDNALNSHNDSQGNGIVHITTPSSMGDNDYLFIGYSDVPLSNFSLNVPPALSDAARFERIWQVDETGDIGAIDLIFDLDPEIDFSSDPANYRLLISSDEDFTSVDQTLSGSYNAVDNSITFSAVDFVDNDFFSLAGDAPGDIRSISTGDWNNPLTWNCTCVPTSLNDVFIEPLNVVTIDGDAQAKNLTVEADGTLRMVDDFPLTLTLGLDLKGNADITDGELNFEGPDGAYFDPNLQTVNLNNISVNVASIGMFFFSGNYIVNGLFSPIAGDIDIDANASFIINSTSATEGGRIGPIDGGVSISGNISVRRNIPSGNPDWRDISSSVSNANLSMWDGSIKMSGPAFPDGCAFSVEGCFRSVVYWLSNSGIAVDDPLEPLTVGRGYEIFMGDDLNTWSGATLEVTGEINQAADIPYAIGGGWSIVGNPYASPIDFSILGRSGVGNYYWIFDAASGNYQSYDAASGTGSIPSLTGIIPTGQGFWVRGPGTIIFNQDAKTSSSATFTFAPEKAQEMTLGLRSNSKHFYSSVSLAIGSELGDDYNNQLSIPKLINPKIDILASEIAIVNDKALFYKKYLTQDYQNKIIELLTDFKYSDTYTLEFKNLNFYDEYAHIYLYDKFEQKIIDLKHQPEYSFFSGVNKDNRFNLILSNTLLSINETLKDTEESYGDLKINQISNLIHIKAKTNFGPSSLILLNTIGQEAGYNQLLDINTGTTSITLPNKFKGIYILTLNNGVKTISKKIVL